MRRAAQLFREGRHAEALPAYRQLLAAYPDLPDSWFNLAMLERAAGDPNAALASYDRALALGITGPAEVHVRRAAILSDDLGQPEAARAALGEALAIDPDDIAALLNLGNLDEDVGDRPAALTAYRRALRVAPGHPLALARLIGLADGAELSGAIDAARAWLADGRCTPQDRADLGFAIGAALDRQGDHDAAFAAYRDANAGSRAIAHANGIGYARAAVDAFVDRQIAAFPADPTPPAPRTAPVVFVCGMFRSGSTLLEAMLARHPAIVAGGELDSLPALIARHGLADPVAVARADATLIGQVREAYLAAIAPRLGGHARIIDKRPDNIFHLALIRRAFPDAAILITERQALDNCLSVYFLHADPQLGYASDLADIGHFFAAQQRLAAHWQGVFGTALHRVDYDQLVVDPRPVLGATLEFLGLDWDERVLAPDQAAGAIRTASNWQVRRPLYRDSSGRWRHYAAHLAPLEQALAAAGIAARR